MYNEERKSLYIKSTITSDSQKEWYRSLFRRSERLEELAGRDLCEFYSSTLRQLYHDLGITLTQSAITTYYAIRRYVYWCRKQGYPTTDDIEDCQPDLVAEVRSCMVVVPHHLITTLDLVFPDYEEAQIQRIFRAYFWLAFSGFTDEEALRVRASDLDFENMCIRFEDHDPRDHPIYVLSVQDLLAAANLQSFTEFHVSSRLIVKDRLPGDTILRGKIPKGDDLSDDPMRTFIRPAVSRAFTRARQRYSREAYRYRKSKYPPSLYMTYRSAYLSGIFYRAWLRERRHRYYVLPKGRENDYQNWKLAFHEELLEIPEDG